MKNYLKIFGFNKNKAGANAPLKRGTILDTNPPFAVLEAYKTLRYNLKFVLSTKNKNSCVISSANMGDGKSTIIANVAISIAQANERVLLIDMDLRRPTQHRLFKIENRIGVSNIIGDKQNLKKAIHKDVIPGLDILTSGAIPPNPSEMVSSNKAKEIVKWAEENYDYVFIDAPPVNIVSDVLALADMTAGVVLVVRVGSTHTDELKRAIDDIQFVNSELLGIVLNSADADAVKKQKIKKGYSYNYSYNYNYTQTGEKDE
ncbi:MAG: CpsD/CapB family tyrosine-protein kinase [Clostridiales bacterium]|nr:CpsD/CapB family tyrosine-protein kinase [Clostridiales bacterium]